MSPRGVPPERIGMVDVPDLPVTSFRLTSLRCMKGRLPLDLALIGTVAVLTGMGITMALLVQRVNCDNSGSPMTVCLGYTNSIHWAYPIIAIGVVCFIAAGVSASTPVRCCREDEPPINPDGENPSPTDPVQGRRTHGTRATAGSAGGPLPPEPEYDCSLALLRSESDGAHEMVDLAIALTITHLASR